MEYQTIQYEGRDMIVPDRGDCGLCAKGLGAWVMKGHVPCADHVKDPKCFSEYQWIHDYRQQDDRRWSRQGWVLASVRLTGSSGYYKIAHTGDNLLTPRVERFNWQGNNLDCASYNFSYLSAAEKAIVIDTMPGNCEEVPFRK